MLINVDGYTSCCRLQSMTPRSVSVYVL